MVAMKLRNCTNLSDFGQPKDKNTTIPVQYQSVVIRAIVSNRMQNSEYEKKTLQNLYATNTESLKSSKYTARH